MNPIFSKNQDLLAKGALIDFAAVMRLQNWQAPNPGLQQASTGKIHLKIEEPISLAVILGFGSGDLAQAFVSEALVKEVLVYEPDESVLAAVCTQKNFDQLFSSPKFRLIVSSDADAAIKQRLVTYFNEDMSRIPRAFSVKIFTSPGDGKNPARAAGFEKFLKIFQDIVDHTADSTLMPIEDDFRGLINAAKNYPRYYGHPAIESFTDMHKDHPAVLVGVGPSLGKTLPILREIAPKAIVIAVDVAARRLCDEGIIPDYVACMERAGTELFFKDLPKLSETYFVAPSNVQPISFERFPGPKIKFYRSCLLDHWFVPTPKKHKVGLTVGHLAFWLARQLGCGPIYLIGHDFSYDPQTGSVYADTKNNFLESGGQYMKKHVFAETDREQPGYDGEPQRTNELWQYYSDVLGNLVSLHGGDIRHILPKGHGIRLAYARRLLPEDALKDFEDHPVIEKGLREKAVIAAEPGKPEYTDVSADIRARLQESLAYFIDRSLTVMNDIADFWLNHSTLVLNQGYEEEYQVFFKKLEQEQAKLLNYDDGFFDKYLIDFLGAHHSRIGILIARLLATEKDFTLRTNSQIELIYDWYKMLHLWCSRARKVMENHA